MNNCYSVTFFPGGVCNLSWCDFVCSLSFPWTTRGVIGDYAKLAGDVDTVKNITVCVFEELLFSPVGNMRGTFFLWAG